jgi:hypothetical protein
VKLMNNNTKQGILCSTQPSTALPRPIPGKRNRSILKTFQSAHVDIKYVTPTPFRGHIITIYVRYIDKIIQFKGKYSFRHVLTLLVY